MFYRENVHSRIVNVVCGGVADTKDKRQKRWVQKLSFCSRSCPLCHRSNCGHIGHHLIYHGIRYVIFKETIASSEFRLFIRQLPGMLDFRSHRFPKCILQPFPSFSRSFCNWSVHTCPLSNTQITFDTVKHKYIATWTNFLRNEKLTRRHYRKIFVDFVCQVVGSDVSL